MSQDRATFQQRAESRLAEARLLLANEFPSGAYYLAGYAIECALKAIIAAKFLANEIPDRRLVERVYIHDLSKLLSLAGLEDELELEMNANPDLHGRWTTIRNGPREPATRFGRRQALRLYWKRSVATKGYYDGCRIARRSKGRGIRKIG